MAYSEKYHERAFQLFALGKSHAQIAETLGKEYPGVDGITRKTIGKWCKDEDWEARRGEVQVKAAEISDQDLAVTVADWASSMETSIGNAMQYLIDSEPDSFEQNIRVIQTLQPIHRQLTGASGSVKDNPKVLQRFMESVKQALYDVPAIAKMFEDHPQVETQLVQRIQHRFAEEV